jgi:hypothetical protein
MHRNGRAAELVGFGLLNETLVTSGPGSRYSTVTLFEDGEVRDSSCYDSESTAVEWKLCLWVSWRTVQSLRYLSSLPTYCVARQRATRRC